MFLKRSAVTALVLLGALAVIEGTPPRPPVSNEAVAPSPFVADSSLIAQMDSSLGEQAVMAVYTLVLGQTGQIAPLPVAFPARYPEPFLPADDPATDSLWRPPSSITLSPPTEQTADTPSTASRYRRQPDPSA